MLRSITLIILLISLLFLVSACNGPSSVTPEEPTEEEPAGFTIDSPVIILVMDNFRVDTRSQTIAKPELTGNCFITPGGFGRYSAMDFGRYSAMDFGRYSAMDFGSPREHGDIVRKEIAYKIERDGGQLISSTYEGDYIDINFDWLNGVELWRLYNEQYIVLVAFDYFDFNTNDLSKYLPQAINQFSKFGFQIGYEYISPIEKFVINMSFGIVPCDPNYISNADYEEAVNDLMGMEGFNDLVDSFVENTDIDDREKAMRILATDILPSLRVTSSYQKDVTNPSRLDFLDDDPLSDALDDFMTKENVTIISIAASGNFGHEYNYPFAPAMWDSVISIGSEAADGVKARYSNPGEILMSGRVYGTQNIPDATSFAAPKFSYLAAKYLLNNGKRYCNPGGIDIYPPMGYADNDGPWDNRSLDDAVDDYCKVFLRRNNNGTVSNGEKVQVRWFVGLGTGTYPDQIEIQESVVESFNASHPNIELILEVVPYDSARDTLIAQIAAGNGPDIVGPVGVWGSNDFYGQWLDLDPLINVTNYDLSAFNPALVNFYHTEQGQIGLPFMVFPSALYYQKNMFDQAGLNYPPQYIGDPYVWPDGSTVEWGWGVLSGVASLLTKDVNGLNLFEEGFDRNNIIQIGYVPQWSTPQIVGTFFGPGLVYRGQAGSYTASIPEGWKEAWYWWFDGMWGDQPFMLTGDMSSSPEFGSGNVFNSGRAAMAVTQLWYTCCLADAGENWDLAALPSNNGDVHGRLDADTFFIWKGTEHPDEAFEVLTYLIGPEGTELLSVAYGGLPALPKYQDAYFDARAVQYPFVENWDLFIQTLNYPDIPSAESWMPNKYEARDRFDAFGQLIQNNGNINFQAELEALEADLEYYFNK